MPIKALEWRRNDGLYTIEGAFTITIFAALFMVILSVMSVIQTKSVLQTAINETAMQLSQKAYAEPSSCTIEACRLYTEEKLKSFNGDINEWLIDNGLSAGLAGLNFDYSDILETGTDIDIVLKYTLNVNTFGLFEKQIQISQRAKTGAWLPYDYALQISDFDEVKSIWKEDQLVRGKYFVSRIKSENLQYAVASGQGVDLYNPNENILSEVYSINIFSKTYVDDEFNPTEAGLQSQLEEYAADMEKDVKELAEVLDMQDGSTLKIKSEPRRELVIVLPNETQNYDEISDYLMSEQQRILADFGISIRYLYLENALDG